MEKFAAASDLGRRLMLVGAQWLLGLPTLRRWEAVLLRRSLQWQGPRAELATGEDGNESENCARKEQLATSMHCGRQAFRVTSS